MIWPFSLFKKKMLKPTSYEIRRIELYNIEPEMLQGVEDRKWTRAIEREAMRKYMSTRQIGYYHPQAPSAFYTVYDKKTAKYNDDISFGTLVHKRYLELKEKNG